MGEDSPDTPKTLAEKLDHLFTAVRPRDKSEYSYRDVAAGIEAAGRTTISASYIHQLRTGGRDNPTKKHLEALADFFSVPAAYFLDDTQATHIDEQLSLSAALRDPGVRNVALRAAGLSDRSLDMIDTVIDYTRHAEGLATDPERG
jgi:transcriptional regulator with XRE-family HTH domain